MTKQEHPAGGKILVNERTAYRTYKDKNSRTNAGVLVANHPVTSRIEKQIYSPDNGFVTANIDVIYTLNDIDVMTRHSKIMMRPDKSEATITNQEYFLANVTDRLGWEHATITREQFEVLKELFE